MKIFLFIIGSCLANGAVAQTRDAVIKSQDAWQTKPECPPKPKSNANKATFYDDTNSHQISPPHVVFKLSQNGGPRAHKPGGPPFQKCDEGKECEICFEDMKDCMKAPFWGPGPELGRFDFSVPFYKKTCQSPDPKVLKSLPEPYQKACKDAAKELAKLQPGINCLDKKNEGVPACQKIMAKARKDKEKDKKLYDECMIDCKPLLDKWEEDKKKTPSPKSPISTDASGVA